MEFMEDEIKRLEGLIKEDNAGELEKILNSNHSLQNCFNRQYFKTTSQSFSSNFFHEIFLGRSLLLLAVKEKRQKVVEYLLSQDFVDKNICASMGENIYHVVCKIRGAEQLFSIIERNVPHHLLLMDSIDRMNAFDIACKENNIFIVKRVHEILESLQLNLTPIKCRTINEIKNSAIGFALNNKDIEVTKYVLSMDRIQLNDRLFSTIEYLKFDIVVCLLNAYLCQSIPSHLHNQFHILQFSNLHPDIKNRILKNDNNYQMGEEKIKKEFNSNEIEKIDRGNQHYSHNDSFINPHKRRKLSNNNDDNDYYLKVVEENFKKIMNIKLFLRNRIWHKVCVNENLDVVQLIFSLKGVQPEILNDRESSAFIIACAQNSNIKVIKYLLKFYPSFIHSQLKLHGENFQNGTHLIFNNRKLNKSDKLNILHNLYLNGIDIHLLSEEPILSYNDKDFYHSIYSRNNGVYDEVGRYLKVISQDFDYINNEHDDKEYRKPSFWKEIDENNNNNHNNNIADDMDDEQSKRVNEWKNRFDEHVLHHLSKMIQEWMI